MNDQNRPLWLLAIAAALSITAVLAASLLAGTSTAVAPDTLDELRDGGDVLLFRHAITDRSNSDLDPTARGTCAQQRNLSPEGVTQARMVGERLRGLGVPLGEAFASPFCRTMETAEGIVGAATPTDALLSLTAALDAAGATAITEAGADLIEAQLGLDDVTVMVTHTQNIEALTGITVEEGDAVVLTRAPDGEVEVVDVVPAADW